MGIYGEIWGDMELEAPSRRLAAEDRGHAVPRRAPPLVKHLVRARVRVRARARARVRVRVRVGVRVRANPKPNLTWYDGAASTRAASALARHSRLIAPTLRMSMRMPG